MATHSLAVRVIGGRTDDAAAAVNPDIDQQEWRLPDPGGRTPGRLWNLFDRSPNPDAFKVRQGTGSDMNIKVGSALGTGRDGFVVAGTVAGQGNYVVRLEASTVTLAVPAADGSLAAKYGVFLYLDDANYSGTATMHFFQLACLRGAPNASPVAPSALSVWSAYYCLWTFQLAAAATAVTNTILDNSNAADLRVTSSALGVSALDLAPFL